MFQEIWEDNYRNGEALNKYPWDYVVSFVFNHYPRHKPKREVKILELGFGAGCNIWFCAREGFDVYGVEASQTAVEHTHKWLQEEGLSAKIEQGFFSPLPYDNEFFDIIIDRASLTCVSFHTCAEAIREAERVLKPGGYFLFTPYSKEHSSFKSGLATESGLIKIRSGSLLNVGDINFYDLQDIKNLTEETHLEMVNCQQLTKKEVLQDLFHSEWHVIYKKSK